MDMLIGFYMHMRRRMSSLSRLQHWLIVDLNSFRRYRRPGRLIVNKDRITAFRVWDIREFPVGILIDASDSVLAELPPLFGFAVKQRRAGRWDPTPKQLRDPET